MIEEVMSALELKIPPVIVTAFCAAMMWLVFFTAPAYQFTLPSRHALGSILLFIGAGIALSGVLSFARAKTSVNPLNPDAATSLVKTGIYRFTRNPMYLGFLIGLLGWAIYLGSALALLLLPVYVLYMNRFQILPEERALSARFGKIFSDYAGKVRRWL